MRSRLGWCVPPFGSSRAEHARCRRVVRSGRGETACDCVEYGCPCAVMNYWFPSGLEDPDEPGVQPEEDLVK